MLTDIRLALRQFAKSPTFTIVALLTLALGIGANTIIFSAVNSALLRPLPFHGAERLVQIGASYASDGSRGRHVTGPVAQHWMENSSSFEALTLMRSSSWNLIQDGRARKVNGLEVSAGFLDVFALQPRLGRGFAPGEDQPESNSRVAMLTFEFWNDAFAGDPDLIGRTINLNREFFEVIGVLPPGALLRDDASLLIPISARSELWRMSPEIYWVPLIGRLAAGVTQAEANAELTALAQEVFREQSTNLYQYTANLTPLQVAFSENQRQVLALLLGGVILVLLIASANVANLLLARATTRQKEMAVRAALGAGGARIIRQVLVESLMLAIAGGALGVLVAAFGVDLLATTMSDFLPAVMHPQLDGTVLFFSLLIACGTGLLVGLAPALRSRRVDVSRNLQEGGRGTTSGARAGIQSFLVVSEVAMTVMLMIVASLLLKSFVNAFRADPGLRVENVLAYDLSLVHGKFDSVSHLLEYQREVLRRVSSIPGVETAATATSVPFDGNPWGNLLRRAGDGAHGESTVTLADFVGGDYFGALGVPIIRGRVFTEADNRPDAARLIVINERLANFVFPDEDPIGKQIESYGNIWEVIGIVGDVRHDQVDAPARPHFCATQAFDPWTCRVIVRTRLPPEGLANVIRTTIADLDSEHSVSNVWTLRSAAENSLSGRRMTMTLVGIFALAATGLAGLGIYGVVAYTTEQRHRELCIRMALGAIATDIINLVLRDGFRLAAWGTGLGIIGGVVAAKLISSRLYGVGVVDPLVYPGVIALLALVVAASVMIPARRAARCNPAEALRAE